MTYFLTEKALKSALVPGYNGFQSFDVEVATILNIETAILLHEIRKVDLQLNYDKKTHIIEQKDIDDIMIHLKYILEKNKLERSLKKLIKKSYIKNLI